jgi:hypothetical protein
MRAMFQKVHDSSVLGMDEDMRKQIQDLLQRTRSRNFLRTLPADLRLYDEALVQIGFGPRTTDAARQQTLNDGLEHFQTDNTDADVLDAQLINLVPRCGYVTLSVCLHSRTFLDYIRTGNDTYDLDAAHEDDDTDLSDEPLLVKKLGWLRRCTAIHYARDSLELFAKVRNLDFMSPIRHYENEYRVLLSTVFKARNVPKDHHLYGFEKPKGARASHEIRPWQVAGDASGSKGASNTRRSASTVAKSTTQGGDSAQDSPTRAVRSSTHQQTRASAVKAATKRSTKPASKSGTVDGKSSRRRNAQPSTAVAFNAQDGGQPHHEVSEDELLVTPEQPKGGRGRRKRNASARAVAAAAQEQSNKRRRIVR